MSLSARGGFDVVDAEFAVLLDSGVLVVDPPQSAEFPAEGRVPLSQARELMLAGNAADGFADVIWRQLVLHAREQGGVWVTAALGMALPGLRRVARRARPRWRGTPDDLESELLTGFLDRLHTVDVKAPRICGRLIDAAIRAVGRAEAAETVGLLPHALMVGSSVPGLPWGHPDWVLAQAVVAAVLAREEALLIGATRLGGVSLAKAAADCGIPVTAARRWRRAAELRLCKAIKAGELAFVPLQGRGSRSKLPGVLPE